MISLIAGLKWADRYDLAAADRSRLVLVMYLLDRIVGLAAALLVGKRQVERLAPPPPEPRECLDGDRGERTSGSEPPDGGAGSGRCEN